MKSLQYITEIIENETEYEAVVKHRLKNIKNFSSLGPPDICYLTKQFSGSLLGGKKNNEKNGYYHYVSGLDCSTAANVSAYIHSLLKKQEKDLNWFQKGEYKILKGYMCIFDSFSRNDIHVEVNIPGSMRIYGYTNENNIITVNDRLWEKAYISSVLRSMNKQTFSYGKVFEELQKPQQFVEFLESLFNIILSEDLPLEKNETNYIFEYNGSKAMTIVMKYLFERKRYILALDLLINYVKISPKCIFFLAQLYWELKKYQDSLQIYSFYILKYPQAVNLYYYQAKQLLDIERYQEAYTIAKYLYTMVPNNFDTNMLLSTIFIKVKSYGLALVALNSASQYIRPTLSQKNLYLREIKVFETENRDKTSPKQTGLSDQFIDLVLKPVRNVVLGIKDKQKENKDQKILQEYESFNIKYEISQDEIKIFQQFSIIIKDIGIQQFCALMSDIFVFDGVIKQEYIQFPNVMIEELKFYEQKKLIQQEQQVEEDFDNEEEFSLPVFLRDNNIPNKVTQDHQSIAKKRFEWMKKKNTNTTSWEKQRNNQQITEKTDENLSSDRQNLHKITVQFEKNPQVKLSTELLNLQLQDHYPIQKRIINNSFNNMFISFQKMQMALNIFQQELDQNQQEFDHSYQVYLFRAFMCDLCNNEKLAIEAYHKILQRCYCFHAWHRLIQLYQNEENFKAIMICMAECMDELEKCGISQFSYLPEWLELSIVEMVSKKGIDFVRNLQQELKFNDVTVAECLEKIQRWRTHGDTYKEKDTHNQK